MIFQVRQRYLKNFELIKQNKIGEIKQKKSAVSHFWELFLHYSTLYCLVLFYSYLFTIVLIWIMGSYILEWQKIFHFINIRRAEKKIEWIDEITGSMRWGVLPAIGWFLLVDFTNKQRMNLAYCTYLHWRNARFFLPFLKLFPYTYFISYLCSANPTQIQILLLIIINIINFFFSTFNSYWQWCIEQI